MAQYEVHVFCDECSIPHPAGIVMRLEDSNFDKASIGDLYNGKDIPPNLNMTNNTFFCPNTRKPFTQKDNQQVFLVAVAE